MNFLQAARIMSIVVPAVALTLTTPGLFTRKRNESKQSDTLPACSAIGGASCNIRIISTPEAWG